ncbi:hypothetical protein N9195_02850 [bacterium]|nr:hypothetical protein [bacterium]
MDRVKIGVTGSRNGSSVAIEEILRGIRDEFSDRSIEIHHGDCIGVDEEVHRISRELGFKIVFQPPGHEVRRSGTWTTIRNARKQEKETRIFAKNIAEGDREGSRS